MHKSNSFADKADGALNAEAARVFIVVEPWGALRWENIADAQDSSALVNIQWVKNWEDSSSPMDKDPSHAACRNL